MPDNEQVEINQVQPDAVKALNQQALLSPKKGGFKSVDEWRAAVKAATGVEPTTEQIEQAKAELGE